ncbi:MAG: response regulator, partial [Rhodospirillales bacterium]|nr:response regulator [Rhodospirillales bacterium]
VISSGDVSAAPEDIQLRAEHAMIYELNEQKQNIGSLIITAHTGMITAELLDLTKSNLLLMLALVLALTAGAFWSTRLFIRTPLNLMRASIEQARSGRDWNVVNWRSNDELGILVQAYNEILTLEKDAKEKLKKHQENLENLVEERTSEIAETRDEAEFARLKSEKAEALLKDAIESISDAFVLYDENDKLVMYNEQFMQMEPIVADLIKPGVEFMTLVERVLSKENISGAEGNSNNISHDFIEEHRNPTGKNVLRHTSDGNWYHVREHRTSSGGTVGIRSNITELKKVEEKLREARDIAEQATSAKAAFLATMSHEIRTPMNGVIGMVDLLVQTELEEDQHRMLSTVRDSAYALLTIINDILDFSKIEAGKLELEEIPFSIRDGLEGVSETLASNARIKGVKLNVHVDPKIPDATLGDQTRLRQILFNIGGNAIKFTEKGKVLIRAYLEQVSDDNKATVRFDIIDSGIGISKEAQADLFKEFSQAESSTTRRFGGTGLGLSISQRLIEMMGGKIEVDSTLGQGSTFTVTLTFPIAVKHDVKSDGYDLSGLNILFVGGDMKEIELDASYLRYWDARVKTAEELKSIASLCHEAKENGSPYDIVVIGSSWSMDEQAKVVRGVLTEDALVALRYVIMTQTRTKTARVDLANTTYVESNPIKRAQLIQSVAIAAGRASPDITYDKEDIPTQRVKAMSVEEAEAANTLILVAEDNPTNQDVIGRQLNMLGYTAEFFDDGKLAFEAYKAKPYAMLLTDCHMPVMDGFELTQAIRKSETGRDSRFPIIAITASALNAEVERCYESGMDDFLAKPLEMPKLLAVLKKWMPELHAETVIHVDLNEPEVSKKTTGDQKKPEGANTSIDPSALKSIFGDDDETFKEILQDFIEPSKSNIKEIETGFSDRSADGVAKAAHKLKSSARSVGANELADLCEALETAGKAEDWTEIDKTMPQLPNTFELVIEYINNL